MAATRSEGGEGEAIGWVRRVGVARRTFDFGCRPHEPTPLCRLFCHVFVLRLSNPLPVVGSLFPGSDPSWLLFKWLLPVPSAYEPAQLSARPAASLARAMRCAALPVLLSRLLSLFPNLL